MYRKFVLSSPRSTSDPSWRDSFLAEVTVALERRIATVTEWSDKNTQNLPSDSNDVIQWRAEVKRAVEDLRKQYRFCAQTCKNCNLICTQLRDHEIKEHDCYTNHQCDQKCEYREDHEDEEVRPLPLCSLR